MRYEKLGNIVVNYDGKRKPLKASDRKKMVLRHFPYYGASGIIDQVDNYIFDGRFLLVSEDGANLVARSTPIAFIASGKFWVNNHAHVLQAKTDSTTNEYLELFLNKTDLKPYVTGSAQPKLNQKNLNNIKIPLPPLETQKKIAEILDAADAYRQKTKALIAKYDELSQSLFLDMFGDPVTNPMGWEVTKLGDVCTKITDGTHQSPTFIKKGIPFLLVSNIRDNKIDFNTKKYISEDEYKILTKSTPIEIGDILYTSVGSYGNPAIIEDSRIFCFQRHIAHLKPDHKLIDSVFLKNMLISPLIKRQADRLARGVAQKTLNLKEIKGMKIFYPPLSNQQEFRSRIILIEKQKQQAQNSLEKAEELFNSLLQKAFKGELVS